MEIAGIILLGFILRIISLDQSLWLDEATSALVVRNFSYTGIISHFSPGDFHPPLYYLLLKFWTYFSVTSETGLRSLSILTGILTIFFVYRISLEIFDKKNAVLSSALLALNGLHIYYSQEARMYSLSTLFTTISFYFFIKTCKNERKISNFIYLSVFLALNSLTDYIPNLITPVFWVFALYLRKNTKWMYKLALSHVPAFILWLMWLPVFLVQIKGSNYARFLAPNWWNVLGESSLKSLALIPYKFTIGRISFMNPEIELLVFVIITILLLSLVLMSWKSLLSNDYSLLIISWLSIPIISAFIIGFKYAIFSYFRFIFVIPAFVILISHMLNIIDVKKSRVLIIIIYVISFVSTLYYLSSEKFHREDWRSAVRFIEAESADSNYAVVFASGNQTEAYQYYGQKDKIIPADRLSEIKPDTVWLVTYVEDLFDPQEKTKEKIKNSGYHLISDYNFNGVPVQKFKL